MIWYPKYREELLSVNRPTILLSVGFENLHENINFTINYVIREIPNKHWMLADVVVVR